MSDKISRTAYGDAPLAAAHKADPTAVKSLGLEAHDGDVLVGRSVTINRPRQELYAFWRDFRNLPQFLENIHRVTVSDDGQRSHWVVAAPADREVAWDAQLTQDVPGQLLAWRSLEGADVRNSGQIEFRDATNGRGTVVTATLVYDPPGGSLGKLVAKLFQKEPHIQARRDLRRFKQLMEAGEIANSTPQAAAPRG